MQTGHGTFYSFLKDFLFVHHVRFFLVATRLVEIKKEINKYIKEKYQIVLKCLTLHGTYTFLTQTQLK